MNKFSLAFVGLASGVISFYLINFTNLGDIGTDLAPGYCFGIATVIYLIFISEKLRSPRVRIGKIWIPAWVLTSIAGYFASSWVASVLVPKGQIFPYKLSFFGAGFMGAFIIALGFDLFFMRLKFYQLLLIGIFGGILGLTGYYGDPLYIWFGGKPEIGFIGQGLTLFVLWQTGIAFALGWVLDRKQKMISSNPN